MNSGHHGRGYSHTKLSPSHATASLRSVSAQTHRMSVADMAKAEAKKAVSVVNRVLGKASAMRVVTESAQAQATKENNDRKGTVTWSGLTRRETVAALCVVGGCGMVAKQALKQKASRRPDPKTRRVNAKKKQAFPRKW